MFKLRVTKKKYLEAGVTVIITGMLAVSNYMGAQNADKSGILTKGQIEEDRNQAIKYVE